MRRGNLSLVLRRLREGGPRSRARLADETGLTKATVSSLVAELVERGLLREGEITQTGSSGRPAQVYALADRVYGIGVEVSGDYLSVVVLDLHGEVRVDHRRAYDVPHAEPARTLDAVADLIGKATREATVWAAGWSAGLTVATPGNVDVAGGRVTYAPSIGWHDVPVVEELARRLGEQRSRIRVENDVKLSAIAEHAMGAGIGAVDLAYLSGEMGVGAGIIAGGRLVRGTRGFSGEIGHLPLNPQPVPCVCGRRSCWETMVGLGALLDLAAEPGDPVRDPELDLDSRLAELGRRADAGDPRTRAALSRIATGLGLGASVLLNMTNPALLVLGGYFAVLGDHLLDGVRRELAERVVAPEAGGCRVELSRLGFAAAALGGAHRAIERVLDDPTVVPPRSGLVGAERSRSPVRPRRGPTAGAGTGHG